MLRVVRDLLRSPIDCSQIVGVGGTIRVLALSLALCVTPTLTVLEAQGTTATTAAPTLPSVNLPSELNRVLRDYERAWGARDAAGLSALFAEDGFVLQGGRPPVRGRSAIRAAYAGSGGPLRLRAFAYATSGDVGYILGGYTYPGAEGE